MKKILLSCALVATTLISGTAHSRAASVEYSVACMLPGNFGVSYTDSLAEANRRAESCRNAGGLSAVLTHYSV